MSFLVDTILFAVPVLGVAWLLSRRPEQRWPPGRPHPADPVAAALVLLVVQPLLFLWMTGGSRGGAGGAGAGGAGAAAGAALAVSYLISGALACLVALASGWDAARTLRLWLPLRSMRREVVIGIGVGLTLSLADMILVPFLDALHVPARLSHQPAVEDEISRGPGMLLGLFMAAVLLAPLVEEYLFRGLALAAFEPRVGTTSAIWLSALLFALLHGEAYLPILLKGLVFAWIYTRRRSLFVPVVAHAANNGHAMLLLLFSS